jgi:uncharacterized protein GlcG (DUF336 family)
MRTNEKAVLLVVLVMALAFAAPVAAQGDETAEPSPCEGSTVSGTVVAVDEGAGVVTVYTGDGLCTVTLDAAYHHPIVALLGAYFDAVSTKSLAEALETRPQGWAIFNEASQTWTWAECGTLDAVPITVVADNKDGSFVIKGIVDGQEVTGTVSIGDLATAEALSKALESLVFDWNLDQEGGVIQAGGEIAAYHDAGMGFGALVKLYALADEWQMACADVEGPCGVTAAELVELFQSGVGMGELFKGYGKPSLRGVGHVRKEVRSQTDDADQPDDTSATQRVRPSSHAARPKHTGPKRESTQGSEPQPTALRDTGQPNNDGPKPQTPNNTGKPDHAGPEPKDRNNAGRPDHAGPKPKDSNSGSKPDQAGPKDKPKGH